MKQHEYAEKIMKEYFQEKYKGIDEKLGEIELTDETIFGTEETNKLETERQLLEEVESELEEWIQNAERRTDD